MCAVIKSGTPASIADPGAPWLALLAAALLLFVLSARSIPAATSMPLTFTTPS